MAATSHAPEPADADRLRRIQRRVDRETCARLEAERLLESKSLELFALNQSLLRLNAQLEKRVEDRTRALEAATEAAVALVETDHLTKIASRARYSRCLDTSLHRERTGTQLTGLLLLDIDDFKLVNDTFGHAYGDELLITVSQRLKKRMRAGELVARIGGDEFAVVVEAPDALGLAEAVRRFHGAFDDPVTAGGVTLKCNASMGVAICPTHATSNEDLQRFADLALYRAKAQGGDGTETFDESLLTAYEFRRRIEKEFRAAVDFDGIEMYYQPIVCLETGKPKAVEALARWTDSRGVAIGPDVFIPLSEQCGLIRQLGRQLLRKALLESKPWIDSGLIEALTFNVSPLELLERGFTRSVEQLLVETGFPADKLVLEITEGVALKNMRVAERVMRRLLRTGIRFALDDFGCGYTNLSYLRRLPISILKIDGSLLVDVATQQPAQVIIRNIVSLCHDLGIRSVCEGAETEGQLLFLRDAGCSAVQGYVFARPTPEPGVVAMLEAISRFRGRAVPDEPIRASVS
jgi:diguanylate cyclase (GGDEF)-like protein